MGMNNSNKVRLVQSVEGQLIVSEFARENVVEAMEVRTYQVVGINNNPRQREELRGLPVFAGVYGPMWDGGVIRYESSEAHKLLSA
jgi:hypothetical protein